MIIYKKFMFILPQLQGFDWNKVNLDKNLLKHNVSNSECEEALFNQPLVVSPDEKHSQAEKRFYALAGGSLFGFAISSCSGIVPGVFACRFTRRHHA